MDMRVCFPEDKSAKVTRMLLDIMFWAMNNDDAPQNLLLISKPFEDYTACDTVMKALERRCFNVVFRPSDKISSVDESTIEIFESLCENRPDGEQKLVSIKQNLNQFQGRILTNKSRKLSSKTLFSICLSRLDFHVLSDVMNSLFRETFQSIR